MLAILAAHNFGIKAEILAVIGLGYCGLYPIEKIHPAQKIAQAPDDRIARFF
jgi:hypothetical protein